MPRAASTASTASRSSRPSTDGTAWCSIANSRGRLACSACRYRVGASALRTAPRATVASPGSSTTRSGGSTSAASSSGRRTVRRGSSASTVPAPVINAPLRARQRCTSARAASPLIQRDSPEAMALRPSRLVASFTRSHGRPRSTRDRKPRFNSRACASIRPCSTAMPAVRRRSKPAPSTCGNGSRIAATTRATPAATSASAQGPVLP